jgi:hypothetical protein
MEPEVPDAKMRSGNPPVMETPSPWHPGPKRLASRTGSGPRAATRRLTTAGAGWAAWLVPRPSSFHSLGASGVAQKFRLHPRPVLCAPSSSFPPLTASSPTTRSTCGGQTTCPRAAVSTQRRGLPRPPPLPCATHERPREAAPSLVTNHLAPRPHSPLLPPCPPLPRRRCSQGASSQHGGVAQNRPPGTIYRPERVLGSQHRHGGTVV